LPGAFEKSHGRAAEAGFDGLVWYRRRAKPANLADRPMGLIRPPRCFIFFMLAKGAGDGKLRL
jgi:hypothetical protein